MLGQKGRERLSAVVRHGKGFITIEGAAKALGLERVATAKLLAQWQKQGWIARARRGLYVSLPITSAKGDQPLEDPWALVPELFSPGYVGGLTAAHYWDLTEQVFRTVFVFTTRPVRRSKQTLLGTPFSLRHISSASLFGTATLWRGMIKVQVSDVNRTIVDMMNNPADGGGIRHAADCLRSYFSRSDANPSMLVEYADRLGNGAIFKRLGFLAERIGGPKTLIEQCEQRLTKGNVKLDPAVASPRLHRRWRLWVPERWQSKEPDHD